MEFKFSCTTPQSFYFVLYYNMFTKLFTLQDQKDSVVWLYVKPLPASVATSLLQSGLLLDFTQ